MPGLVTSLLTHLRRPNHLCNPTTHLRRSSLQCKPLLQVQPSLHSRPGCSLPQLWAVSIAPPTARHSPSLNTPSSNGATAVLPPSRCAHASSTTRKLVLLPIAAIARGCCIYYHHQLQLMNACLCSAGRGAPKCHADCGACGPPGSRGPGQGHGEAGRLPAACQQSRTQALMRLIAKLIATLIANSPLLTRSCRNS